MPAVRARDVRAIIFCALTSVGLALLVFVLVRSLGVAAVATGAWLIWLLSRPRMRRVMRRLRGEPVDDGWGNYFQD